MKNNIIDFDEAVSNLRYMGMEIPQHTQECLENYYIRGYEPGGFVSAMLARDYHRAITIADQGNRQMFWAIATWIKENSPKGSYGDYATITDWCCNKNQCRTLFVDSAEKKFMWQKLKDKA